MASEKNLNAVFTDIANAIRAKKGTTEQFQPINMAEEIANLPSGGSSFPPDWAEIGYGETPQYILDGFEYAKKIASEWVNTTTSAYRKYANDKNLVFFPLVDTSKVTDVAYMFIDCSSLIAISQFDASKVTSMYQMFNGCSKLTTIPQLDTSSVKDMSYMFQNCSSLKTIPQLDTSRVTDMRYMFYYCSKLTTIPQLDTSSVNYMSDMFQNCYSLKSILMYGMKVSFSISSSTRFEESDLVTILNNLATVTSTQTLTMGSTNLAKLTDEEKAIATNKGWTLK